MPQGLWAGVRDTSFLADRSPGGLDASRWLVDGVRTTIPDVLLGQRDAIFDQLAFDAAHPWQHIIGDRDDSSAFSQMLATRLIGIDEPPLKIDILVGQFKNGLGP